MVSRVGFCGVVVRRVKNIVLLGLQTVGLKGYIWGCSVVFFSDSGVFCVG